MLWIYINNAKLLLKPLARACLHFPSLAVVRSREAANGVTSLTPSKKGKREEQHILEPFYTLKQHGLRVVTTESHRQLLI